MGERTADMIVTSRLLILQSKRIMLGSARRKLSRRGGEQAQVDVELYETGVARAQTRYGECVLRWASPTSAQYRLIAYGSLIAKSGPDRQEVLADVSRLESILKGWRSLSRESMTEAA
jgi:hypothetical protein